MTDKQKNDFKENVTVRTNDVVTQVGDQVRDLIDKGNARRFIVRKEDGDELINVTLTVAVVTAVVISALLTPIVLVLAAIGGMFAKLSVEIAREIDDSAVVDMTDYDDAAVDDEEKLKNDA